MNITPTHTYVADNLYYRNHTTAVTTTTVANESTRQTSESDSASGDRVTFSNDLSIAQTREAMGLNPTGKLKLTDLESVAQDRRASVASTLAQTMQSLGIGLDREISLTMDGEDKIHISGDFPEKAKLEEALNENETLITEFKQLSANQSFLDYISQLQDSVQNNKASLADFLGSQTDFDSLLSLAEKYENLKSSDNSMETLLTLSSSRHPYSYTHAVDGDGE